MFPTKLKVKYAPATIIIVFKNLENSSHKRNQSLPLDAQCPQTEMAHIWGLCDHLVKEVCNYSFSDFHTYLLGNDVAGLNG